MPIHHPIILFGTGRSGSTMMAEILLRNRDIGFPSNYLEKKPSLQALNLIRYIFDNQFYRIFGQKPELNKVSLINRLTFKPSEAYQIWRHLTGDEVDFSREFLHDKVASDQVKNRVQTYFEKMLALQRKNRLGFKITGPSRLTYLSSLFPDAFILRITRKFLPTLHSFLKVPFWQSRGKQELWWKGAYTEDELAFADSIKDDQVLFTAFQLKKLLAVTEEELQKLPLNIKTVAYEDFVENPKAYLTEMLDWLNLPHDKACYRYLEENQILNTNKYPETYFDPETLKKLEDQLGISI